MREAAKRTLSGRYRRFAELRAREREGADYRIVVVARDSPVVVVAPHGGSIEKWTSELAAAIAADDFSLYCFEGLRSASGELHITSHRFDEPRGVSLVVRSRLAIGVHGRAEREDSEAVWLGGLDTRLRDEIAKQLKTGGFMAKVGGHPFPAEEPNNICNRGKSGAGVQLELPMALRNALFADQHRLNEFAHAVRHAIRARLQDA